METNQKDSSYGELIFKYFHDCLLGTPVNFNAIAESVVERFTGETGNFILKTHCVDAYQKTGSLGINPDFEVFLSIRSLCNKYDLIDQINNLAAISTVLYMYIGMGYAHTGKTGIKTDESSGTQIAFKKKLEEIDKLRLVFEDLRKKKVLYFKDEHLDHHTIKSISFQSNLGYTNIFDPEIIEMILTSLMKEKWSYARRDLEATKDKFFYTERHKVVYGLMQFLYDNTYFCPPDPDDPLSIKDKACEIIDQILKISKIDPDDTSVGSVDAPHHIRSILRKFSK